MESFEDLGAAPELTEALAAEGIESPTPLQEAAIPVLRKGNNLLLAAGPGSGLLHAWAVGLLSRLEPVGDGPLALVVCATTDIADSLAESVARLGSVTGHTVAALGKAWVLPERAQVLFGTAEDLVHGLTSGELSATAVDAIVVDQAQLIDQISGLEDVERVLDYLPEGAQRVLSALPMTTAVTDLTERTFKRAMTLPATASSDGPSRGEIRFRVAPEPRESAALAIVEEVLSDGARHVLVFCRSEDRAADMGDYLTLRGFTAGAPGDESVPVWLGVDALAARSAAKGIAQVVVVSSDAPWDSDTLDRRHSISGNGVVIVLPRELAHVKSVGRQTGYVTVPFPPPPPGPGGVVEQLRQMVERAMEEEDLAPYLLALEPLFDRFDPAEVAAAAVALLRKRDAPRSAARSSSGSGTMSAASQATSTPAWAKLFVGVGERDGLRAGDLLGAITGETGVSGESVGKIEIKESHSIVEVHDAVARKVIQAINGTTIKGRAVRADFDRPRRGTAPTRRPTPRSS
ncbi:MAG: DbpA RNA binding domain-containing protein [Gemmatimonadetes bacterium]|nr:DbpA RNA binding domain-containing protein [Gemmatimonadota bacterium]